MNIQELLKESKERCPQCGMSDCTCAPGTCKCKPIAGWIPNKGFKKQGVGEGYVPINKYTPSGNRGPTGGLPDFNPMAGMHDTIFNKAGRGIRRMKGKDPYGRDDRVHYDWDTIDNKHKNLVSPENYWSREYSNAVNNLNQAEKELANDPKDKYSNHKDNIKYYTNHIAKIKDLLASNGVAVPPVSEQQGVAEDHEIQMADSELKSIYQNSRKLLRLIKHYSEQEGLEAWQQSKITKAADYLNSVLQAVSGQQKR
jgi:hypothetical protein